MNFTDALSALDGHVRAVGFERFPITLDGIERPLAAWRSAFGVIVAVDAASEPASVRDIIQMIRICDGAIARLLDESSASGVELDAHLCFFLEGATRSVPGLFDEHLSEAKTSLFVSRKYFLDAADPVGEFLLRVTVLWPRFDADDASIASADSCPADLQDLRSRLSGESGASVAAHFLERIREPVD